MFPAMLPPPTPFKLFLLAAAAFEMNFGHFLLAIFLGRFARFLLLSFLTLKFGPDVVHLFATLFQRHLAVTLAVLAAASAAGLLWWIRKRQANQSAV
jgi:membrane protein DedA with SNARE-associated domain